VPLPPTGGARTWLTVDEIQRGFILLDRGDEENSPGAVLGRGKWWFGLAVVVVSSNWRLLVMAIHGGSPGELRSKWVQGAPVKLFAPAAKLGRQWFVVVMAVALLRSSNGESWTGGLRGLLFIGGRVLAR
jgi:hypothetical protein